MSSQRAAPFRVKICGITCAADARAAVAAGADAIGVNFVGGSPRCLSVERAREVVAAVPTGVLRVGVFVGATAAEIRACVARVGLDAVQLHGRWPAADPALADPPESCAALAGLTVIRALHLAPGTGQAPLDPAREWIARAAALGHTPELVLIDATPSGPATPGALGGTGRTVDWQALRRAGALPAPVGLAGGLRPDNVALAIEATGVVAVDVASGVESAPGRKDPVAMERFIIAARGAFAVR